MFEEAPSEPHQGEAILSDADDTEKRFAEFFGKFIWRHFSGFKLQTYNCIVPSVSNVFLPRNGNCASQTLNNEKTENEVNQTKFIFTKQ